MTSDIPQIYDTLPPSAPPVAAPNATDDMELTNELLKSLIEGKFFQTTHTHTYPVYQRSRFLERVSPSTWGSRRDC